jgi:bifunctional DNA-binding transcriptional regulator/antitoxin component of YhaV-PrlF toxin-antitoxin module
LTLTVELGIDGELYIQLPDELLEQTGWQIDDILIWTENEDGSYTIGKANDSSNET